MSLWEDYDGTTYQIVGSCTDGMTAGRVVPYLIDRLFPGEKYVEHLNDVRIQTGYRYGLGVRVEVWEGLTPVRQAEIVAYVDGWTDAID